MNFNLFWRLERPHQPEEYRASRVDWQCHLIRLRRSRDVDPVRAKPDAEVVCLRLQQPTCVIGRPGNDQGARGTQRRERRVSERARTGGSEVRR